MLMGTVAHNQVVDSHGQCSNELGIQCTNGFLTIGGAYKIQITERELSITHNQVLDFHGTLTTSCVVLINSNYRRKFYCDRQCLFGCQWSLALLITAERT